MRRNTHPFFARDSGKRYSANGSIMGFSDKTYFSWDDLQIPAIGPRLSSILYPQEGSETPEEPYTNGTQTIINSKYTLTDNLWTHLQAYAAKHRVAGNNFVFGLMDLFQ